MALTIKWVRSGLRVREERLEDDAAGTARKGEARQAARGAAGRGRRHAAPARADVVARTGSCPRGAGTQARSPVQRPSGRAPAAARCVRAGGYGRLRGRRHDRRGTSKPRHRPESRLSRPVDRLRRSGTPHRGPRGPQLPRSCGVKGVRVGFQPKRRAHAARGFHDRGREAAGGRLSGILHLKRLVAASKSSHVSHV